MARPTSKVRMGYFPLPEAEARRIRQHVIFPASNFTALDPCAGEGKALAVITDGGRCQRCGIELDAYRAEEAKQRLDQVIYGDCFDVECKAESCSCMIVNPPYDTAPSDEGAGQRLESLFLQHTYRWLKPGGVLILVIPVAQLAVCGNIMSLQFKDVEVYRLSEPESVQYKQVVVFAVRRTRRERERLQEREISGLRLGYGSKSRNFDALPVLTNQPQRIYAVPEANPVELAHRGLPLDEIEDLLPQSPAYRQARRILFAPEAREKGRPLSPLHQGHVALLATSGLLDGNFGEGKLRHLARWQAVKTVLRLEEEDENGVTTIREKEQFSHALNILYADGHTAVLTNDPPPEDTDQKTAATDTSGEAVPPAAAAAADCRMPG
jgi:prepilin-type processing-associated H-X9-DG protein